MADAGTIQPSIANTARDGREHARTSCRPFDLRGPGPVLACRKCLRRMAGGAKLKKRLKASLKQRGGERKKERARLVLTDCFGICPKGAVVAGSAATLQRRQLVLIRDTSKQAADDAAAALIPHRPASAADPSQDPTAPALAAR